jgi:D-alanine-D-alanine ligase
VVFNLLEEFGGLRVHMPYLLGYLELMRVPYTGCNPRGLIAAHSKPLVNRLLRAHRIRMPEFVVCRRNGRIRRPRRVGFPFLVKSATEHGSTGIAQASVVRDDEQLRQRVEFIHENLETDAIVEQFIEGREIYVGIIGNLRLQTFTIWELTFRNLPENAPNIATAKVKWDPVYQEKVGVTTGPARDLSPALERQILRTSKRVYRILGQSGYARIDYRLSPEGELYVLECNPNPQIAYGEDFAESAEAAGVSYQQLLQRILNLGIRYAANPHD